MNSKIASRSLLVLAISAAMAFALPACTSNPHKTGAEKTGEVVGNAAENTGEVISDSWITTKVKSQFAADELVKALDINVSTTNGLVTLAGIVDSSAARNRAISITKGTKGVKRVDSSTLKAR